MLPAPGYEVAEIEQGVVLDIVDANTDYQALPDDLIDFTEDKHNLLAISGKATVCYMLTRTDERRQEPTTPIEADIVFNGYRYNLFSVETRHKIHDFPVITKPHYGLLIPRIILEA